MRSLLFTIAALTVALALAPVNAHAAPDIYTTLKSAAPGESVIVLDYLWVYGITERVELRGDGLLRVERHVHDRRLFDNMRAELAEKGTLSPYGMQIYSMEEGEYDKYWVADLGSVSFAALVKALSDAGFPDIEDTYGDWEVWAVTLRAGSTEARVGRVMRNTHEGFESVLIAIEKLADKAKNTADVDKADFDDWFANSAASIGGAS
jgi:hypothetical protein